MYNILYRRVRTLWQPEGVNDTVKTKDNNKFKKINDARAFCLLFRIGHKIWVDTSTRVRCRRSKPTSIYYKTSMVIYFITPVRVCYYHTVCSLCLVCNALQSYLMLKSRETCQPPPLSHHNILL